MRILRASNRASGPDTTTAPIRRRRSRAQRFLAAGAAVATTGLLLAACSSSKSSTVSSGSSSSSSLPDFYGTLPPDNGTPTTGGTVTIGAISGSTADYIFPIVPEAQATVFNDFFFIYPMWLPLYWSPVGTVPEVDPTLSLASAPSFSNGNKTVTIDMKSNYKWSNGAPVDARDLEFMIDLAKAAVATNAADWNNYSPGYLPDNIASMSTPNQYTLVLNLTKAYNPQYFYDDQLDLLQPLPSTSWDVTSIGGAPVDWTQPANAKAIYNFLAKQSGDLATYATNPLWQVVDGPMRLTSYTPATGAYTQVPNPDYSGPQKATVSVKAEVFTSQQAQFNQLLAGNLDVGFQLDFSNIPQFPELKNAGYSIYGYPDFGFQAAFINFKDKTNDFDNVISQLYARETLNELINQPGIISGIFHNAAAPSYGPVPAIPKSPFTPSNATTDPYPYSLTGAANTLKSNGWTVVPNGQSYCSKPGTGPGECGAGIPAGTKFDFTWIYANTPVATGQIATAIAAAAKQVGITITLNQQTFNNAVSNYNNPSAPANENEWGVNDFGGFTQSLYPTTNTIFNTHGSYNLGSYNSPTADQDIHNSVGGSSASDVTTEASYLTSNLPALFLPNPDYIYAVKNGLEGPANSWTILTQQEITPQYWFFTKS